MSPHHEQLDVRQIGPDAADYHAALHLALRVQPSHSGRPSPSVVELLTNAETHSIPLDLVFGTYIGNRLVASAVAAELPGAAALVFFSGDSSDRLRFDAGVSALRAARAAAFQRTIRLLQSLVPLETEGADETLIEAGFYKITRLLYLTRSGNDPGPSDRAARDLGWVGYAAETEPLFRRALDLSYVESLDCPELTGLRSTADVLAGHRASGIFEPALWWVATRDGRPVGVSLLNRVAGHASLEIIYLGVAHDARGTGVADAMLDRIVRTCRSSNVRRLILAVDSRNTPALGMYNRWSFIRELAMDAWIASSPMDDG